MPKIKRVTTGQTTVRPNQQNPQPDGLAVQVAESPMWEPSSFFIARSKPKDAERQKNLTQRRKETEDAQREFEQKVAKFGF